MKYIIDLDDTLIQSTVLNNDAYSYALEKCGYTRLNTKERLMREKLQFISGLETVRDTNTTLRKTKQTASS